MAEPETLFPDLPLGYSDPEAYLLDRRFHLSLKFRPTFVEAGEAPHRVTYAVVGSEDKDAPVVFWMNGMGGHRMAAILFDGFASHYHPTPIKFISMDRPSTGGSTPIPLSHRVKWTHEAFLAILSKENITKLSLLSHSNGVIYATHTLLNLPKEGIEITSWTMCSPFVSTSLSGSTLLGLARCLPATATASVGSLLKGVVTLTGPFNAASGWSSGIFRDVKETIATSTGLGSSSAQPEPPVTATLAGAPPVPATPAQNLSRWIKKNNGRELEKRQFSGRYFSSECFDLGLKWSISEGMDGMGQEALLCLRKGEGGGTAWEWGEEDEMNLYETAFGALRTVLEGRRREGEEGLMPIRVISATDDGLIPAQGRKYLKELLVGKFGLVRESDWTDVDGAGHDEPLGREFVAKIIFDSAGTASPT